MLLDSEFVLALRLFDEGVEIFAGNFLDFFTLAADERVVTVFVIFFLHLATNVALYAVNLVNELELLHDLNDAVHGNGVEIDFVLLEGNFTDLVWRKRT